MDISPLGTPDLTAVTGVTPATMTSPPPTPHLDGTLTDIAQALSMQPPDLRSALRSGSSITDLAQQQGVSRDALVSTVEAKVQQQRQDAGQPPLDATQLDRMVSRAFDRHRTGHGHGHHHGPAADATTSATPTSAFSLAAATTIAPAADSTGATSATATSPSPGGGIDVLA